MRHLVELNTRLAEAAYQETIAEDMHGFMTKAAYLTNNGISILLTPLSFLNPLMTFILGLLGSVTFTIALVPFQVVWFIMLGWLLGTSWLWLKAPILRPLLFLPGVLIAPFCGVYVGWMPSFGELDARLAKINAGASWPLTAALWHRMRSR